MASLKIISPAVASACRRAVVFTVSPMAVKSSGSARVHTYAQRQPGLPLDPFPYPTYDVFSSTDSGTAVVRAGGGDEESHYLITYHLVDDSIVG
jgi:hypothetical protein